MTTPTQSKEDRTTEAAKAFLEELPEETRERLQEQLREHYAEEVKSGSIPLGNVKTEWFKSPDMEGTLGADSNDSGAYAVSTTDREKVTIYDTRSGQPSDVLVYMVAKKLGYKHGNGQPVWTLDPSEAPEWKTGTLKCLLHPEHPDRQWLDSIGLADQFCGENDPMARHKENIPTEFQVQRHMEHKHPTAWRTIREAREREEKEEERKLQKQMLEAMSNRGSTEGIGDVREFIKGVITEVMAAQTPAAPPKRRPGRPRKNPIPEA